MNIPRNTKFYSTI